MKVLLTGRDGQVGWELERRLQERCDLVATDRKDLDLADADALRRAICAIRPDVIVNAAAYTAVDKAESERDAAAKINAIAPGVMAEEARRLGTLLVHYSTDYVFNGEKTSAYDEDDAPDPLNTYGRSKLEGEGRIRSAGCRHLIFRTSWIYGLRGRNFLLTVLNRARRGERLRIVGDQFGVPNWSATIARVTLQCLSGEGLFHLSASGMTSWYGFACAALRMVGGLDSRVDEISSSEYPTTARRPRYSVLSNRKLERTFGLRLADWQDDLAAALASQAP